MNCYCLIKKTDLTQEQINYSVNNKLSEIPIHTSTSYLLGIFPIDTEYHVVEFSSDSLSRTNSFDGIQWYNQKDMLEIKDGENNA